MNTFKSCLYIFQMFIYQDHVGPVTSARFNHNSTSIVSGSETGEIIVYNVTTGQGCRPLKKENVQVSKKKTQHQVNDYIHLH